MRIRGSSFAALALIVAACGSNPPTLAPTAPGTALPTESGIASARPTATQDLETVTKAIEGEVVAIRGLPQKAPVDPKVIDAAAMKAYIEADFAKENPADTMAADERLAKTLGLLPATASLADLARELLSSQVVGLYSPDDKALYVLQQSAGLGPSERMIFAHEFTHALQDQAFDLVAYGKANDPHQGDRNLARLSLVEGDASAVMTSWAQSNLTLAELLKAAQQAADPAAAAVMAKMPAYLRETTLFPYASGEAFVTALGAASGRWDQVNAAYAAPPETTEQVLHPAKWTSREPATAVTIPAGLADRMGAGWRVGTQDTLGEFVLGVWLRGAGSDLAMATTAAKAAAGWGGDRVVLLDGPSGARAVALLTAWDSAADADEFAIAARSAIASFQLNAEVVQQSSSSTVRVLIGSDDETVRRLYQVLGVAGV